MIEFTDYIREYLWERWQLKHPNKDYDDFERVLLEYKRTKPVPASGNIFDVSNNRGYTDEVHTITRLLTQYYLELAFEAMKIEPDSNTMEVLGDGNIGSPGRIAKCWCGANTGDDTEMGSGRFMKPVRIATFPNTQKSDIPITKRISIMAANCSHHFLPFSTLFGEDSYAIVSYIPDRFVLGISKLQRLTDYVCRRFWLQEDLTKALYDEISKAAQTPDVFVGLYNIKHTCEWLRGSKNPEGGFTSEYWGGKFDNPELRKFLNK